jgi:hypothetical protein
MPTAALGTVPSDDGRAERVEEHHPVDRSHERGFGEVVGCERERLACLLNSRTRSAPLRGEIEVLQLLLLGLRSEIGRVSLVDAGVGGRLLAREVDRPKLALRRLGTEKGSVRLVAGRLGGVQVREILGCGHSIVRRLGSVVGGDRLVVAGLGG